MSDTGASGDSPPEPARTPVNISRANVTQKIPKGGSKAGAKGSAHHKPAKMSRDKRHHVRKLKKRGLISERAASAHEL